MHEHMNTITVTTPENIEIQYRLAGPGSRMAAAIIDFAVIGLAILLIALAVFFSVFEGSARLVASTDLSSWITGAALIACFTVYFGYFIISECAMKGQSIGKKVLKLRVIRQNGRPITFFQSVVRNLFRYFLDMHGIGALCMFFHGKSKRVGDIVAGTVVVAENPGRIQLEDLSRHSPATTGQVILTNGKYAVSDEELALLLAYFSRKDSFIDGGRQARDKLIAYFSGKFDIGGGTLDEDGLEKILSLNMRAARF